MNYENIKENIMEVIKTLNFSEIDIKKENEKEKEIPKLCFCKDNKGNFYKVSKNEETCARMLYSMNKANNIEALADLIIFTTLSRSSFIQITPGKEKNELRKVFEKAKENLKPYCKYYNKYNAITYPSITIEKKAAFNTILSKVQDIYIGILLYNVFCSTLKNYQFILIDY